MRRPRKADSSRGRIFLADLTFFQRCDVLVASTKGGLDEIFFSVLNFDMLPSTPKRTLRERVGLCLVSSSSNPMRDAILSIAHCALLGQLHWLDVPPGRLFSSVIGTSALST